jgi:cell division protein FtsB
MRMPGECYTEQIAGLEWHLERSRAQCERLKSALEAAEAENAELRARVAELEGMMLKWVSVSKALDEDETRAAAAMAKREA